MECKIYVVNNDTGEGSWFDLSISEEEIFQNLEIENDYSIIKIYCDCLDEDEIDISERKCKNIDSFYYFKRYVLENKGTVDKEDLLYLMDLTLC